MTYQAEELVIDGHTDTHTSNNNTRRPKLSSGNKKREKRLWVWAHGPTGSYARAHPGSPTVTIVTISPDLWPPGLQPNRQEKLLTQVEHVSPATSDIADNITNWYDKISHPLPIQYQAESLGSWFDQSRVVHGIRSDKEIASWRYVCFSFRGNPTMCGWDIEIPNFTLKIQDQGHGQCQTRWSHLRPRIQSICLLFISSQLDRF